jgi:hypothetical protein
MRETIRLIRLKHSIIDSFETDRGVRAFRIDLDHE